MSDLARTARGGLPWLVIAGVLVAALSLRGPIVAPTPVLRDIEQDFGIGAATAGLITTAPVLMFALLTPVAALVIRRAGPELALLVSLCGVLLGTFIRALPGFGWMLAGMVVIGAAITIGNVVMPVIIRRDIPPAKVATMMAAYTATLNVGSLITTLLTAPLAAAIGWNLALVTWSLLTVAGVLLWGVHLRRSRDTQERYSGLPGEHSADLLPERDASATITGPMPVIAARAEERSLLRRPVVWILVGAFGAQCGMYYALTTWLPALTADEFGLTAQGAGALASVFQAAGIVGAFVVPVLARFAPRLVPAIVIGLSWIVVTAGMLLAPQLVLLWLMFGGLAHAGGFVVVFTAIVAASRSDSEAAGMSALVQGGGYALGALGAPAMGWLHDLTGGWSLPLAIMVGISVAYTVALVAAVARAR